VSSTRGVNAKGMKRVRLDEHPSGYAVVRSAVREFEVDLRREEERTEPSADGSSQADIVESLSP
jgi:hypothetical protein